MQIFKQILPEIYLEIEWSSLTEEIEIKLIDTKTEREDINKDLIISSTKRPRQCPEENEKLT